MLQGKEKVLIRKLGFFVALRAGGGLLGEAAALLLGVVQLAECVGYLHPANEAFEPLHQPRVVGLLLR